MIPERTSTTHSSKGFTLVELSIVLVVVAMIAAGVLTVLTSSSEKQKNAAMQTSFATIEQALMSFRKTHDRLPCPANPALPASDANYGVETGPAGTCAGITAGNTIYGIIPTKTLGLSDSSMLDGWGRRITYMVDKRITQVSAFTQFPMSDPNIGSITVKDSTGTNRTDKALVALISHGTNGHGAFSRTGAATRVNTASSNSDEHENCDCDVSGVADASKTIGTIVQKNYTRNPASALGNFDDQVLYKMRFHFPSIDEDKALKTDTPKLTPDLFVEKFTMGVWPDPNLFSLELYDVEESTGALSKINFTPFDPPFTESLYGMDISDDNNYLALFSCNDLRLFGVAEGDIIPLTRLTGTGCCAQDVVFSKGESTYLAVIGLLTHVKVYKRTGNILKKIYDATGADMPSNSVYDADFSPDNKYLGVGFDGGATIYKRTNDTFTRLPNTSAGGGFDPSPTNGGGLSFSNDGKWAAVGDGGNVKIYRADPGDVFTLVSTTPRAGLRSLKFSPDSSHLIAGLGARPFIDYFSIDDAGRLTSLMTTLSKIFVTTPWPPSAPTTPANSSFSVTGQAPFFTFLASDFTGSYADAQGDPLNSISISTIPNPLHGVLKLSGVDVVAGTTVTAANLGNLTFHPLGPWTGTASFDWRASDGWEWSGSKSVSITITLAGVPSRTISAPATPAPSAPNAYDFSIEGPGPILNFSLSDFTASYADYEGDPLDSITIQSLPNPAHGKLKYGWGSDVSVGQRLNPAELDGLRFHAAPGWLGTTTFTWCGADTLSCSSPVTTSITTTFEGTYGPPTKISYSADGKFVTMGIEYIDVEEHFAVYRVQGDELVKINSSFMSGYGAASVLMKK